jgi:hypothetical protein
MGTGVLYRSIRFSKKEKAVRDKQIEELEGGQVYTFNIL